MGITETLINFIKPLLDQVGVPVHNLGLAALDVVVVVGVLKRQLNKYVNLGSWGVWVLGFVASAVTALQFMSLGWAAVLVGTGGVFILSVVQLAISGRLGHFTPTNKFGANPSKNTG